MDEFLSTMVINVTFVSNIISILKVSSAIIVNDVNHMHMVIKATNDETLYHIYSVYAFNN